MKYLNILSRGMQEILHRIDNYYNDNFVDETFYWISWSLKAEKRDKKINPSRFKELKFMDEDTEIKKKKCDNDWFMYLLKKIVVKSKSCKNTTTRILVKGLADIAKFEYNPGVRKDRIPYLAIAIYLLHKDKPTSLSIPITNINIFSNLNINKFFEYLIPTANQKEYQKQYEEIKEELCNQKFLIKEYMAKNKNYKKAKLNDKLEYLNILVYKNDPKGDDTTMEYQSDSRKITDYL